MKRIFSELEVRDIFERIVWRELIGIECFGSKLGIRTDSNKLKEKIKSILPFSTKEISFGEASEVLSLIVCQGKSLNGLYFNNELALEFEEFNESLWEFIKDKILTVLALISLPEKFYLHAGGVVWNDFGIIMPGQSFSGKTTLVEEFIKAGAEYFSDDCVVLNNEGYLLPFPNLLAVRTENGRILKKPEDFGAEVAAKKAKLKLILLTNYKKGALWKPRMVSQGQGILQIMENFYYKSSIGKTPEKVLSALSRITREVLIIGGERSEADLVVEWVQRNFISKQ